MLENGLSSLCLLRIHRWILDPVPHWFPNACENRIPTQLLIPRAVRRTRIQRGGLFRAPKALLLSFPELSSTGCSAVLIERKWQQEGMGKFLILNKRRRWFHSSRVKLPSVNVSASWFLVSKYLIWAFGSKLTLSNNPSNATVGLLHLIHLEKSVRL